MVVKRPMLGHKVCKLRTQRAMSQTHAASRLGISPSYLNLIEHDRRPMTRSLMVKMADMFDVDIGVFSNDEEQRLVADLKEAMGDPVFAGKRVAIGAIEELVNKIPDAGRTFLSLYSAYRRACENVQSLGERLSDDIFLSASVHELLTVLTSIRSFSEILRDNSDIASSQRQRFLGIIVDESENLSAAVNRLLEFAKGNVLRDMEGAIPSSGVIADFIESHGNYFDGMEKAAERLCVNENIRGGNIYHGLKRILEKRHGIRVEVVPWDARPVSLCNCNPKEGILRLSEMLSPENVNFQLARHIALLSQEEEMEAYMEDGSAGDGEARAMCRDILAKYFAGAVLMPYDSFFTMAEKMRYDIELLQHRFGVGFEQVCHRLTTLKRPGAMGVPFHFLRIDIAGNVSKRYCGSGIRIPRFGGICPRWNVHTAFMSPGRIDAQLAVLLDGSAYFCLARTIDRYIGGYGSQMSHLAVGIGCDVANAGKLVYADGVNIDNMEGAVPIGLNCRMCERDDCLQRAFPMSIGNSSGGKASVVS